MEPTDEECAVGIPIYFVYLSSFQVYRIIVFACLWLATSCLKLEHSCVSHILHKHDVASKQNSTLRIGGQLISSAGHDCKRLITRRPDRTTY